MATISLRLSNEEEVLIKNYVKINKMNLSEFIRDTILDKIEDDLKIDEERILKSLEESKKGKVYTTSEVWEMLGLNE
ncbi:MAG: DUF6290 family protein [Fusobacterium gastrosuis]|uniref:type II toxin-antitoxin system RelB family antitoxin n=1 Tax=Fusobacterium gastrosuis TaxID=1755100 RepID=UPI002A95CB75|nr:DUF6290 family protein [Fusobacterium gastrosuis]